MVCPCFLILSRPRAAVFSENGTLLSLRDIFPVREIPFEKGAFSRCVRDAAPYSFAGRKTRPLLLLHCFPR